MKRRIFIGILGAGLLSAFLITGPESSTRAHAAEWNANGADWQGRIVVANRGSGTISVIDVRTDTLTGDYALPAGPNPPEPMYVFYTPIRDRVFVGDRANNRVVVLKAAESFIEALNNLEWERFRKSFVADATVFFPAEVPGRAHGSGEVEAGFKRMFDEGRKQGGGPPYLRVEPRDVMIQMAGTVAVMSFHLKRPGGLARRTIVWQKRGGRWLILHLHASGVMLENIDH